MTAFSATELLRRDHREMERLLERWEAHLKSPEAEGLAELAEIFAEIQLHLAKHFRREEETFYPALQPLLPSTDLEISKLSDDHSYVRAASASFQELINQAKLPGEPAASLRADLATVGWALWNHIHHHIAVEENGLLAFADRALTPGQQTSLAQRMQSVIDH